MGRAKLRGIARSSCLDSMHTFPITGGGFFQDAVEEGRGLDSARRAGLQARH
jgi:hypothetical protein